MKKIVLILTSFIMIMGLTACGRQVNTAESSEASGTATPEAEIAQSPSYQTANPDNVITDLLSGVRSKTIHHFFTFPYNEPIHSKQPNIFSFPVILYDILIQNRRSIK